MDGFGGAPRFLAYPRTFTVQNGADAVLTCQIAGDPRPSILWEKDRTPIEPSGRFHVEAKGNVYSLLVSRVTPEDSGLYVCKAKNNVGETYAAATLKVEAGEPQEEGGPENKPPVFLVRPSSMRVCRGEDVMFTCRVSGQPCPALHWEKDGHKLSDLFESSHFSVGKEPEDWHFLKLFSARPPDGGVYVCRARSGSQEALAAAVLLVEPLAPGLPDEQSHGSPGNGLEQPGERQQRHWHTAVQSSVPEAWALPKGEVPAGVPGAKAFAVSAGKHAKFRCYVTGKPKPEITWKKDGKPVTPGRRHLVYEDREGYFILKVLYCKPQDQGLYICTASNTAGQTLSAVQLQVKEHRMRFQVQLADVEVQEWEDAVLECHVPLENIPTAWYLEDKELQPSHKYVMEEQGVVRRLTIRDARTDDDGVYLCQMKDKGRSIAEVSVRGMIVKRLPRKLDVMEGENAAFCVETREAVEGICWSRNGQELQESSHTVLKSFGRTHLLVLVHVTREEAGVISFAVGESQTSSQLRVKCVKRDPPSTPVAARMSTEHSNAALLTWCPAPDVHHCPPSSYVLERQEVSASEWVHCLTTDLASLVEVLGDSVPCEADYRFRICAVNKYGRSGPVEFPGSVHLVPAARLERGLQDVLVWDGEDAHFSLELSASVRGTWFLNGTRLGDEEGTDGRYCVQHCKTEHSLLIRGARLAESGAQVTFVSSSIRDLATLQVRAPQAHIAPVPEAQRLRKQPAGLPVLLECEVSPPGAPVRWLKDGEAVPLDDVIAVQAEGCVRRLLVRSAGPSDSGIYTCDAGDEAVSFVVTVTEPPVRIVSSNEDAPHAYAAQERVVLWCELSRADAPVCWYKDGLEVEAGESLVLEREGPQCRLVLPCAQPQDAGEFVCDAGGDSVFYNVMVAEPPVRIVSSNEDAPHAYAAQERVVLWCELSRADAPVCWYKDGLEVEAGESLVLEREGPQCRLVLPCAQPQDAGEFVCDAGGDSVFYNVTVAEPPVRIVSSNEDAPHAYAAQERVVLWCELSRADAPVCWYKDGLEVEAGESLVLEHEGPQCRLVLPCAQPQDAGEFVCDAGDASASYSVTVAEPRVRILHPLQRSLALPVLALARVELQCELSVPDAPVRWFKDGLEVDESNNLLLLTEGAQRRLVILKASVEDAGEYICESRDEAVSFDVQVSELPVKILQPQRPPPVVKASPGETVMLACELSRADAPVCWAKDGVRLEAGGSLVLEEEGAHRRLLIPAARVEHSGKYVCDTIEDAVTFTIQVSDPLVRILERDALPTRRHCRALEDLVLEVHLSHAHGEVKWYKDGEKLQDTGRVWLEEDGARRSLVVLGATRRDAGEYLCDTRDDSIIFCVTVEAPEPPVTIVGNTGAVEHRCLVAGEDLVLACKLSRPDATVRWLRDGQEVQPSERVRVEARGLLRKLTVLGVQPGDAGAYTCDAASDRMVTTVEPVAAGERCELRREGRVHSLVLSNVSKEDAGVYTCLSRHDQMQFDVSVKELLVKFLRGLADMHVHEGETVVLWCELCKAKGDVVWLKDGRELAPSARREIKVEGRERSLVLSNVGPEDAGEYSCESNDDRTLATLTVQVPRVVEIIMELHSLTVLEGEDATFKCVVSPEDVALTWQLNGQAVAPCERLVAQVLFVRRLQDVAAEEQQDVCLEVEVSHEAAEVQWMKQGVILQPGGKYELQESGRRRTLTIRSLSPSDRGTYRCESLHDRTQAKLCVEPRKVSIRTRLADVETFEKETATFHLELSHAGVPGVWTRDGIRVKPSGTCQISAAGCAHSLTLQRLTLEDSGTVAFTADTLRCSARLLVREPPVTMVKVLRDLGVPEMGAASFECELSRPTAEVKWYKDGTELRPGPHCRIYSVGRRRLLQLSHCELADAGVYTCDAGDCQASATLHVHERQVRIVQELQDACVQENENAVFTCEASHGDVKGEWFRDGEKIKVTSTVKIRQEGTKHFLLICGVRPEDAGLIRFVAKTAVSEANLRVEALPIRIVKPLRDKTVLARHKATLECTVSHARGRVRWFRGNTEIFAGDKYEICNLDCYRTLIIHHVGPEDEDSYTCDAFDDRSTARLLVEGEPWGAEPVRGPRTAATGRGHGLAGP
nr:PREDICTED: obscurin-like protein 1 [Apteryx mantelli mantelli]